VITNSIKAGVFLEDLENITRTSAEDLSFLVNKNVLLTGSTGFVGTWLAASYLYALETVGGSGSLTCVARSFDSLDIHRSIIHSHTNVNLLPSDIRSLDIPRELQIDIIIHAATPASASLNTNHPLEMISTIVDGQRRILDQAVKVGAKRVVFMSSGAVYGPQPMDLDGLPLGWNGGPQITNPANAYHEAKRLAELLGHIYANNGSVEFVTARLFAFLAPFLPLDQHFAAGNFIRDVLLDRSPMINSDGMSIRSYQYGSDMATWLWAIAARGTNCGVFNVGSSESISVLDLARAVVRCSGKNLEPTIVPHSGAGLSTRYVPDLKNQDFNLNLSNQVVLENAIQRTLTWNVQEGITK
jgi:nucleoside-diphosphate-sugar epimerase